MPKANINAPCLRLVTSERGDIFAIGRLIAQGLEPELFQDRKRPVKVSIRGSYASGKTIIAEAGRRALIGITELTHGHIDMESWKGRLKGKDIEITYVLADGQKSRIKHIQDCRQNGGIAYVQNAPVFGDNEADIDVWIEGRKGYIHQNEDERAKKSSLSDIYRQAAEKKWGRYVEIRVRNPKIAASKKFQAALKKIADLGVSPDPSSVEKLRHHLVAQILVLKHSLGIRAR
jgi:hypothetical protein